MLVLDGHESHELAAFQDYCKLYNIITLGLPPHSSHLTQPLDVGCFSPLKRAYGRQLEDFIRAHITHITKVEFFMAFKAAYIQAITVQNAQGGFRGAGLVPFNPQTVISKLDIRLRTPSPNLPSPRHTNNWVSQTPHNSTEALAQTTLVKNCIALHQGSSPTPIFNTVVALAKGTEILAHENTLLAAEVRSLRKANEALSKRRRAKKKYIRQGGTLTIEEAHDIIAQEEAIEQVQRDRPSREVSQNREYLTIRHCSSCGNTGHNARTCQEVIYIAS